MSKYETPSFDVLKKDGDFEIRKYNAFYIVEYDNENDPEINNGFQTLFNYISSENKENKKISMTVPVIQEEIVDKKKMAFVVPEKFGNQIPEPTNTNLKVKKFDEGLFAVIKYSGFSNKTKEEIMKKKLFEWLKLNGYNTESNYMVALYNAPFIPPMFRKNEILVQVV